jgi:DNA-binding transcriptional ArsR family regulator
MARPSTKELQRRRRQSLRPHPVRDRIIEILRAHPEPLSPSKISDILGTTLGATAYHVRTLAAAGVVEVAKEGRVRGAVEHFYALTSPENAAELADPIDGLLNICGAATVPGTNGGLPTATVLDAEARSELQGMLDKLAPRVRKVAAASTKRASGG